VAIPLTYNLRSLRQRWSSAVVAVLGIAGTVGVFVAMLALARGFQSTLVASGSPNNAIVVRAGANAEMVSAVTLEQVKVIEQLPGVARGTNGPRVSSERVLIAAIPLKSTGTDANAQVRGVSANVLSVHDTVHITRGRFFQPGLAEILVGKNAATSYSGFTVGNAVKFGGGSWKVVGLFDSGGSAFDSEIWADAAVLAQVYQRRQNVFQSVTVRLTSPAAFTAFKDAITSDPRLTLDTERETVYYARQSELLTKWINVLGSIIAVIMGLGAIFGALNTMYSAVASREREIATMRALGFGGMSVVVSFVFESLVIAWVGALIGCIAVLPLNGLTTGTMNWKTFSHLSFAFRIDAPLMLGGIGFGLLMGFIGGVFPAVRAARRPIVVALRDL
jgi:putative ABC transport system permease protein